MLVILEGINVQMSRSYDGFGMGAFNTHCFYFAGKNMEFSFENFRKTIMFQKFFEFSMSLVRKTIYKIYDI